MERFEKVGKIGNIGRYGKVYKGRDKMPDRRKPWTTRSVEECYSFLLAQSAHRQLTAVASSPVTRLVCEFLRVPETGPQFVALKLVRVAEGEEGIPPQALREISLLKELSHPNLHAMLSGCGVGGPLVVPGG